MPDRERDGTGRPLDVDPERDRVSRSPSEMDDDDDDREEERSAGPATTSRMPDEDPTGRPLDPERRSTQDEAREAREDRDDDEGITGTPSSPVRDRQPDEDSTGRPLDVERRSTQEEARELREERGEEEERDPSQLGGATQPREDRDPSGRPMDVDEEQRVDRDDPREEVRDQILDEHPDLTRSDIIVEEANGEYEIDITDEGQARLAGLFLDSPEGFQRARRIDEIREDVADQYDTIGPDDVSVEVDGDIAIPTARFPAGIRNLADEDVRHPEHGSLRDQQLDLIREGVAGRDDDLDADDISIQTLGDGLDIGIRQETQQELIAERVAEEDDRFDADDLIVEISNGEVDVDITSDAERRLLEEQVREEHPDATDIDFTEADGEMVAQFQIPDTPVEGGFRDWASGTATSFETAVREGTPPDEIVSGIASGTRGLADATMTEIRDPIVVDDLTDPRGVATDLLDDQREQFEWGAPDVETAVREATPPEEIVSGVARTGGTLAEATADQVRDPIVVDDLTDPTTVATDLSDHYREDIQLPDTSDPTVAAGLGIAAIPEPTPVTEAVGVGLVAAGAGAVAYERRQQRAEEDDTAEMRLDDTVQAVEFPLLPEQVEETEEDEDEEEIDNILGRGLWTPEQTTDEAEGLERWGFTTEISIDERVQEAQPSEIVAEEGAIGITETEIEASETGVVEEIETPTEAWESVEEVGIPEGVEIDSPTIRTAQLLQRQREDEERDEETEESEFVQERDLSEFIPEETVFIGAPDIAQIEEAEESELLREFEQEATEDVDVSEEAERLEEAEETDLLRQFEFERGEEAELTDDVFDFGVSEEARSVGLTEEVAQFDTLTDQRTEPTPIEAFDTPVDTRDGILSDTVSAEDTAFDSDVALDTAFDQAGTGVRDLDQIANVTAESTMFDDVVVEQTIPATEYGFEHGFQTGRRRRARPPLPNLEGDAARLDPTDDPFDDDEIRNPVSDAPLDDLDDTFSDMEGW